MRPGAFRWVFEVRTDVGYIAKVAIGSWSYVANFFLETWYPEVELLRKAAALLRSVHIMSRK